MVSPFRARDENNGIHILQTLTCVRSRAGTCVRWMRQLGCKIEEGSRSRDRASAGEHLLTFCAPGTFLASSWSWPCYRAPVYESPVGAGLRFLSLILWYSDSISLGWDSVYFQRIPVDWLQIPCAFLVPCLCSGCSLYLECLFLPFLSPMEYLPMFKIHFKYYPFYQAKPRI